MSEENPDCIFCGKTTERDGDLNGVPAYTCKQQNCHRTTHCTREFIEEKIRAKKGGIDVEKV